MSAGESPSVARVLELAVKLTPEEVQQLRRQLKPFTHDQRCRALTGQRSSGLYMCHLGCPIRRNSGKSVNE